MRDRERSSKKSSWLCWKIRRPGPVCTEMFQDLTVTFVAQWVQSALRDAAKGSARGRPVYKDCGWKREFGLITECWVVPGQGTGLGTLRAAGRVPQCRVACGGATLLLLA